MSRRFGMIDDKFAHYIAGHPVSAKLAIYDVILFLGEKYFLPLTLAQTNTLSLVLIVGSKLMRVTLPFATELHMNLFRPKTRANG